MKQFEITYLYTVKVLVEAENIEKAAQYARLETLAQPKETCKVAAIVEIS